MCWEVEMIDQVLIVVWREVWVGVVTEVLGSGYPWICFLCDFFGGLRLQD